MKTILSLVVLSLGLIAAEAEEFLYDGKLYRDVVVKGATTDRKAVIEYRDGSATAETIVPIDSLSPSLQIVAKEKAAQLIPDGAKPGVSTVAVEDFVYMERTYKGAAVVGINADGTAKVRYVDGEWRKEAFINVPVSHLSPALKADARSKFKDKIEKLRTLEQ